MPSRKQVFTTGEFYHIYNRSVAKTPIFSSQKSTAVFLDCLQYYRYKDTPVKFSIYRRKKDTFSLKGSKTIVSILAFCLMPNHFHLLLRQNDENGILSFVKKISNSFAHYYSQRYESSGHVFQGNFKASYIEDDEQLLHVSRYIHLNPYTSFLVDDPKKFQSSSLSAYLLPNSSEIVDTSIILGIIGSSKNYEIFIENQKNYQRKLKIIKHLCLDL
jgi:putative transposase